MVKSEIVEIENLDEWKRTLDDLLKYVVFPKYRAGKKSKDLVYNHVCKFKFKD